MRPQVHLIMKQRNFIDNINKFKRSKTVIISTHKFEILKECDIIYEIKNKSINKNKLYEKNLVTGSEGFMDPLSWNIVKKIHIGPVQYNSFNSIGWINDLINKDVKTCRFFGDIRDMSFLDKIMQDCDVVFNLAALIGIPSHIMPTSYFETNVKGTLNILEAAKKNKIKKVIITSTSEVYGTGQYLPIDENILSRPITILGLKNFSRSITLLLFIWFTSYNYTTFNTYGPRQSLRAIIPTIIQQILINKKRINLGNVKTTRDFSYVSDTVDGFIKSINSKSDGEIINLVQVSNKYWRTCKKIGHILEKVIIKKDKKRLRPKNSEVERLKSSNIKAKKILNWSPKFTGKKGLREGIKKTLNWFLKNKQFLPKKNSYNI